MKSLYISYDGLLEPLGQSQIIPYLKGLSKEGVSFIILSFDKKCCQDNYSKDKLSAQLQGANIEWVSLLYHKNPPLLSTSFDVIKGLIKSMVIMRRASIDIVHARGYVAGLIALVLKKIFKLKFIFDTRGFWADEKAECSHWSKKGVLYKLVKYLESKFIKNADEVVVLTKQDKDIIQNQDHATPHISVIPCCVDTDIFKLDPLRRDEVRHENNLSRKFVFAYTGSLEPWYMKEEMLDYFKAAKEIVADAHFLILSQSPKKEIIDLMDKKQLNKEDFTITSVAFDRMPEFLSMVDAGIIFLSLGFSKAGCYPTKFAEFLSCGVPVISNANIGDTQEIILNNRIGVIVNNFNADEYKRTFLELLSLKEDTALESRCRKVVEEKISLRRGINGYRDIYARLGNEL